MSLGVSVGKRASEEPVEMPMTEQDDDGRSQEEGHHHDGHRLRRGTHDDACLEPCVARRNRHLKRLGQRSAKRTTDERNEKTGDVEAGGGRAGRVHGDVSGDPPGNGSSFLVLATLDGRDLFDGVTGRLFVVRARAGR